MEAPRWIGAADDPARLSPAVPGGQLLIPDRAPNGAFCTVHVGLGQEDLRLPMSQPRTMPTAAATA
jgi:hypothetical protein